MGGIRIWICALVLLLAAKANSQGTFKVEFEDEVIQSVVKEAEKYNGPLRDTLDLANRINALRILLYENAYLQSKAELSPVDSSFVLRITAGQPIQTGRINIKTPTGFLLPLDLDLAKTDAPLSPQKFRKQLEEQLVYLENNGYPFASIQTEGFELRNDSLHLNLIVDPGPLVTIDSLVIKGFEKFSKNVIKYDLNYRKGMVYRESYLTELKSSFDQIEYLDMSRPPAVAFTRSKTVLYLYVEEVKSNQIDGVVGINTDEAGTVTLNGDLQLRLLHVFKKGEEFNIRWRSPDQSVQALNFDMEIPYLFRTPLWLEGNLAIFRQDSTFVNTDFQGLLKYLLETGSFLSGGVNYRSSNVLLNNESNTTFKSFNTLTYKLGLELRRTDRILVPTKGFEMRAYGHTGRRISEDANLDQFGWQLIADQYFRLLPRHIINVGVISEAIFGGKLFTNELYRLGGLKTLRGFNEQSIYASRYGGGTLEYRYMIGTYDYLALFSDLAYVENNADTEFASNFLLGLGAGINFQTRAGIFSLFYAVGKVDQNPFDLRTSKIHFGYINRF